VSEETLTIDAREGDGGTQLPGRVPVLVIVWAREGGRVGESFLPGRAWSVIGRGGAHEGDPCERLLPVRMRPAETKRGVALKSPSLSRVQLKLRVVGACVEVTNVGRRPLRDMSGRVVDSRSVAVGELVDIEDELVLLCCERPSPWTRAAGLAPAGAHAPEIAFGGPDAMGFVGESEQAWEVRSHVAFLAARAAHVLVLGPSGVGKEVVAQGIHLLSSRRGKRIVARNAATFPESLVDAELFGNAANYPNHGMPERPGVVGEADGSTLFLDEIGELPDPLQSRLLRLLDGKGEYQRLGDARRRTVNLRFIGATHRPLASLRHDLAARMKLRLTLPGLDARREDIPLLARHLLRRVARDDSAIGSRFFDGWDGHTGEPRVAQALATALVRHTYTTHVRELEGLLWRSVGSSRGGTLELTADLAKELEPPEAHTSPDDLTEEDVRAALARAGGKREEAWRALGLANRYVLKRLMKRFGLGESDAT